MKTQNLSGEFPSLSPGVKNNSENENNRENIQMQSEEVISQFKEESYEADDWFNESAI